MPSYSSSHGSSSRHTHSSRSSSSRNDVYLSNGSGSGSSRRSKVVRDKKWYCAWCHFGPMDWSYNYACLECQRPRDNYSRIEYQERRVHVT